MTSRLNGRSVGTGLLAVLIGGGAAWAFAQQPAQPNVLPPVKTPEKHEEQEGDDEAVIKLSEAPEAVRTALSKVAAAENVTKVVKEADEGITTYEIEYKADGLDCSVVLSPAGDVMESEKGADIAALPAATLTALKKDYPNASFQKAEVVTKVYYEVQVVINGRAHEVKCDAAGNIEDEAGGDEKHEGAQGQKDKD